MSVVKTFNQIVADLISYLKSGEIEPNADTLMGTAFRDWIETFASRLAVMYEDLDDIIDYSSLQNATSMSADGLSDFARNFGVTRIAPTKATGTVRFKSAIQPTAGINIPLGTKVRTIADEGVYIEFQTTEIASLEPTASTDEEGYYYVDVLIEAVNTGISSNVGEDTLVVMSYPINGIEYVTNLDATSGGTDEESAEALRDRILSTTSRSILGTRTGYISVIKDQFPTLVDVDVVGPDDEDMERDVYGGSIDIQIIGVDAQPFTQISRYYEVQPNIYFDQPPIINISSIQGTTTLTNFIPEVDYRFVKDTSRIYGYSTRAFDYVEWLEGGSKPGNSQQVTIVGNYDKMVVDVYNFITDPTKRFVTADILVKQALLVPIYVECSVTVFPGYSKEDLKTLIEDTIIDGITNLGLGDNVEQADIVSWIYDVDGVDEVALPFTTLSTIPSGGVSDISIKKYQYPRVVFVDVAVI